MLYCRIFQAILDLNKGKKRSAIPRVKGSFQTVFIRVDFDGDTGQSGNVEKAA